MVIMSTKSFNYMGENFRTHFSRLSRKIHKVLLINVDQQFSFSFAVVRR